MKAYQIYELDKIPESAAVNESVALAKKYCRWQRSASGLVNGVLRNAVRTKGTLKEPKGYAELYSHPQELIDLLAHDLGKSALEPMLKANNSIPDMVVQVNTLRTSVDALVSELEWAGVCAKRHPWMEDCLVLSGTGDLEQLNAFREGLFYVQDAASRLAVMCAQIEKSSQTRVLDCCAAPGGKTFAAAIAMGNVGKIRSCDIHKHKIALIENGAQRLGLQNVSPREQDATKMNPKWLGKMDVVLCDVPCSGYGIIRKKPDIRYKNPREMELLPQLQLQILHTQADYVKPGGTLIYSTCTLLRRENEAVVTEFLEKREDFYLEKLPLPAPLTEQKTGMLTLIPGQYDTDGFFIARLRRKA